MTHPCQIELSEPALSRCDCCDGLSVRLTRFLSRDDEAFAVYYATYANHHPDGEVAVLVSLGEWGEESDPSQRAAFYCRVRPTDDSYQVMLGDAGTSEWSDATTVGEKLSAEAARQHPWKAMAFETLEAAFEQDPSLRGFMLRAQCGDASIPLEKSFQAPDDIFNLDAEAQAERARLHGSLAALDAERFFVRCLLPIPVEHYGTWCLGIWVEVARADFERVTVAWDDPELYPNLRFAGVIANDLSDLELGLPLAENETLQLHVTDPETPPTIKAPVLGPLADLLTHAWPRDTFEKFAVARGYL